MGPIVDWLVCLISGSHPRQLEQGHVAEIKEVKRDLTFLLQQIADLVVCHPLLDLWLQGIGD